MGWARPRLIRLLDLADDDMIAITCPTCLRCKEYGSEYFQHMRFPSDMLLFDLRYRVGRCSICNRGDGLSIEVRKRGYPPEPPIVIAERDRL